ncbi:MAG: ATP-binding protein [Methylococcaceae bacterium]|nr:ATP-binding protein [Methylococcaceae bacterium]
MKHYLPTIYSNQEGFTQLARLKSIIIHSTDNEIVLNFSRCGFFDANMAASLKAVLAIAASKSKKVSINELRPGIERVLRKNHFLTEYGFNPLPDTYQTTLPYRCFQTSDSRDFNQYLKIHLSGKNIPKMSQKLNKKFRESIFEIFENCATHSHSTQGIFVCGQYYPQKCRLDLTVSDTGVGIRTNVRRILDNKTSSVDAICWALIEGNTTRTGNQPGGFGLALLQNFIEHNKGKIQIVSRHGYYEFSNGHNKFEKLEADFPGTTINLEINTNDDNNYCLSSETTSLEDLF